MNFNTTNNTFRQLMGNGLSYRVPLFQRDYSWGPDEWDDLWQDIVALFEADPEPAHYMGYLVLQSVDNRAFDIIDGQQRMTTLSLLMLAAVSHLSDLAASDDPGDPQARRAEQLRASYIGYLDPVSLVPRSKLTLNRHNDSFYQNYLVPLERLPQRGLNASEHLLRRAFSWFKDRIRGRSADDGTAVASFVDGAVDKLFFTVITVTDELNAFKVFETLNARGVRLSATDLLKNYLFSVVARGGAHESEISSLEGRWEAIVGLLGSESLPEFLRVYWNSRHRLVRKADLFKTIRGAVDGRSKVFALVRDLDRQARVYAALRDPDDASWTTEERASLSQLQMFSVRQPLALLLAAFDRYSDDDRAGFTRLLRAVAVVSLRYNVICGRQSNEQESIYNQVAVAISQSRLGGPRCRGRATASGISGRRRVPSRVHRQDAAYHEQPQQEGRPLPAVPGRTACIGKQLRLRERPIRPGARAARESGRRLATVRRPTARRMHLSPRQPDPPHRDRQSSRRKRRLRCETNNLPNQRIRHNA